MSSIPLLLDSSTKIGLTLLFLRLLTVRPLDPLGLINRWLLPIWRASCSIFSISASSSTYICGPSDDEDRGVEEEEDDDDDEEEDEDTDDEEDCWAWSFFFFFLFLFLSPWPDPPAPCLVDCPPPPLLRLPTPTLGLDLSASSSPDTATACLWPPGGCLCLCVNPIPSLCFCTSVPCSVSACCLRVPAGRLRCGSCLTGSSSSLSSASWVIVRLRSPACLRLPPCCDPVGLWRLTWKLKLRLVSFCSTVARSLSAESWLRLTLTGRLLWARAIRLAARTRQQTARVLISLLGQIVTPHTVSASQLEYKTETAPSSPPDTTDPVQCQYREQGCQYSGQSLVETTDYPGHPLNAVERR